MQNTQKYQDVAAARLNQPGSGQQSRFQMDDSYQGTILEGGGIVQDIDQMQPTTSDNLDQQRRAAAEQLQAAMSQQYGSNFSAVSIVQDEIQDQAGVSELPTEALIYQPQQQQQHMLQAQANQRKKEMTTTGVLGGPDHHKSRQIGNIQGDDEENGLNSRPPGKTTESHASTKMSQVQNVGAKKGDDEIDPLGSDDGDNGNGQHAKGLARKGSKLIMHPCQPDNVRQHFAQNSNANLIKSRSGAKTTRNSQKRALNSGHGGQVPPSDFEQYFKTLITQVNNKKAQGSRTLWSSKSSHNLKPHIMNNRKNLGQLQPVRTHRDSKIGQSRTNSNEFKKYKKPKSTSNRFGSRGSVTGYPRNRKSIGQENKRSSKASQGRPDRVKDVDEDTEVYTERSISHNSPDKEKSQNADVELAAQVSNAILQDQMYDEREVTFRNANNGMLRPSHKSQPKHNQSQQHLGRRGSRMGHNFQNRNDMVLPQRSSSKTLLASKSQMSQPKYNAARHNQFMSRQLSYQMKKNNKISAALEQKKKQEIDSCTFQPQVRHKTSRKNEQLSSMAKPGRSIPQVTNFDQDYDPKFHNPHVDLFSLSSKNHIVSQEQPLPPRINDHQESVNIAAQSTDDANWRQGPTNLQQIRSIKIDIDNKGNEVIARLNKNSSQSTHKFRTREQFLQAQEEYALRKQRKLEGLKQEQIQKWKEVATFQPQIDKVSRVLGQIQIQQKYSAPKNIPPEVIDQDVNLDKQLMDDDKIDRISNKSGGVEVQDPEVLVNIIHNSQGPTPKIHDRLYTEAKERSMKRNQLIYDTMKEKGMLLSVSNSQANISTTKPFITQQNQQRRLNDEIIHDVAAGNSRTANLEINSGNQTSDMRKSNDQRSSQSQSKQQTELRRNRGSQQRGQRPGTATARSNQRSIFSAGVSQAGSQTRAQQNAFVSFLSQPKNSTSTNHKQPKQSKVPKLNNKSKLYFIQKFTKEIIKVWQDIPTQPDDQQQQVAEIKSIVPIKADTRAVSRSNQVNTLNTQQTAESMESAINQEYIVSNPPDDSVTVETKSPSLKPDKLDANVQTTQEKEKTQQLDIQPEPSLLNKGVFLLESARQNETMNFEVMRHVLMKLGFAKEFKVKSTAQQEANTGALITGRSIASVSQTNMSISQQAAHQESLLLQMWMILGGPHYQHVTLNNLRMVLLAVKGFHVQPDVGLDTATDPDQPEQVIRMADVLGQAASQSIKKVGNAANDEQEQYHSHASFSPDPQKSNANVEPNLQANKADPTTNKSFPTLELNIGIFNKNGDFYMNPHDVEQSVKYFQVLNQNRQLFEQNQLLIRKDERARMIQHTFRPFVDPKNNLLAEKSRERHEDKERALSVVGKQIQIDDEDTQGPETVEKRGVSPILQRLTKPALSPRWIELQQQQKLEQSERECTFKPNIQTVQVFGSKEKACDIMKKSNKKINRGINLLLGEKGQPSTQEKSLSLFGANQKVSPLNLDRVMKNQDPMKFKSKDLMEQTGDKFNDLFVLSKKIDFLKPKRDKSTDDLEYEKGREECTFQPNKGRKSNLSKNKDQSQAANGAHHLSTQQSMIMNESIRDSNDFNDIISKRKLSHTAKSTSVPFVNQMNKNMSKVQNLFTSQFNGIEATVESNQAATDLKENMKQIKGVEEAIDRINQTQHEKAVVERLKKLGLMLNERNVRKVEAMMQIEDIKHRESIKTAEQEKQSRSGSIPRSFIGSIGQSASQKSKKTFELNKFDNEQLPIQQQKIFYEEGLHGQRYSFCEDSQAQSDNQPININAHTAKGSLQDTPSGLDHNVQVPRLTNQEKSISISSHGKIKPFLQSVRELGGEDNEATVEEEPETRRDELQNQHSPSVRQHVVDTIDTVGNIESPVRALNMLTTGSHTHEKVGGDQQSDFAPPRLNGLNGRESGQLIDLQEVQTTPQNRIQPQSSSSKKHNFRPSGVSPAQSGTPTLNDPLRQSITGAEAPEASFDSNKLPLLEVDINITPTHTERIQIFSGDRIDGEDGIAKKFCQQHGLGESMEHQLRAVLTQQVQEAISQNSQQTNNAGGSSEQIVESEK